MPRKMSLFSIVEKFPPRLCRFLARKAHGQKPMSHRDISKASGLSVGCISKLSMKTSWKGVDIDIVERFSNACGVNLLATSRQKEFLERRKHAHILSGDRQQKKFFARLLQK